MLNQKTRYDNVAVALHWGMGLLILWLLAGAFLEDILPRSVESFMWSVHKPIGIMVLALAVFRVIWRWLNVPPAPVAGQSKWQEIASYLVHWLLYLAMLAIPLLGWLMVSVTQKYPIDFFGLGNVPFLPLPEFNDPKAMRKFFYEGHELFANGVLALIGLHVLAALKHQFYLRDGLMLRMMPKRRILPRRTAR